MSWRPARSFLLLVASVSLAAGAEERPRVLPVAVALGDNARERQGQLQQALESALKKSARHDAVDPVEQFDGAGVEQRARAMQ